jgi:cytochrome b
MNPPQEIKVWDPLVRIFHWTLVVAFTIAFVTEEDFLGPHIWAGYLVMGLITVRIFWGFFGTYYARFSNFVYSPAVVKQYLKDTLSFRAKRYIGHNPAGGAMILLLIVSLIVTTVSGIVVYGLEGEGPLMAYLSGFSEATEDLWEEVHEFFANFTVLLVLIHVGGVVFESLLHRENLVDAMISGNKRLNAAEQPSTKATQDVPRESVEGSLK